MNNLDPEIIYSVFCREVTVQGATVEVSIVRMEHENDWSLEVVNGNGTSTCWQDTFSSDIEANAEFERTLKEEGIQAFLDDAGNVVPFPKRP
jgi:hypothetical protein